MTSSSSRSMALLTLFCLLVALNAQTTGIPCLLDNVDLVFVLDSSGSIKPTDFAAALTGLTYFVNGLKNVGPRPGQSRVGMVSFSSTGRTEFGLDWWSTVDQVNSAILNVTQIQASTNISDGMRVGRTEVYGSVQQNGHSRLMLVITDGHDSSNVTAEGWLLHNAGVTVYAIGIGEDVDTAELVRVAGSASRVVTLTSWLNLTSIWEKACAEVDSSTTPPYDQTETFPSPTPKKTTPSPTTTTTSNLITASAVPTASTTPTIHTTTTVGIVAKTLVPLYRLCFVPIVLHYMDIDANIIPQLLATKGWAYEGIEAYMLPPDALAGNSALNTSYCGGKLVNLYLWQKWMKTQFVHGFSLSNSTPTNLGTGWTLNKLMGIVSSSLSACGMNLVPMMVMHAQKPGGDDWFYPTNPSEYEPLTAGSSPYGGTLAWTGWYIWPSSTGSQTIGGR